MKVNGRRESCRLGPDAMSYGYERGNREREIMLTIYNSARQSRETQEGKQRIRCALTKNYVIVHIDYVQL